ncbi:Nucleoporin protein Ndc1-Nup [Cynara cardunculus var. scolymus]|uniref:Nucleoporin protein Ndc1-Nup n=1 Tax=Cynara cardunculus var. scolymus TaxID=59895 RepID=A0A103Y921_CYNCS|nr:Nucleoporin protein Ndc1-Nup [Cynara cardunculus var. scolymus]
MSKLRSFVMKVLGLTCSASACECYLALPFLKILNPNSRSVAFFYLIVLYYPGCQGIFQMILGIKCLTIAESYFRRWFVTPVRYYFGSLIKTALIEWVLRETQRAGQSRAAVLPLPNLFQESSDRIDIAIQALKVCAWCARIASSLTVRSHKEDRFGVAQLSGSNAATISTLLACLLAVETLMGKKTNLQSSTQYLTGPANIKWAALSPARRDAMTTNGMTANKKDGPHYSKAYSMADILRTSIYQVVSNFHQEMVSSSKAGLLEKDWIVAGKPLYENHELLVQKLRLFLEFQAN